MSDTTSSSSVHSHTVLESIETAVGGDGISWVKASQLLSTTRHHFVTFYLNTRARKHAASVLEFATALANEAHRVLGTRNAETELKATVNALTIKVGSLRMSLASERQINDRTFDALKALAADIERDTE